MIEIVFCWCVVDVECMGFGVCSNVLCNLNVISSLLSFLVLLVLSGLIVSMLLFWYSSELLFECRLIRYCVCDSSVCLM